MLLGFAAITVAQQDPMYSLYVFNGLVINPAYAGNAEVLRTSLLYRNQWTNVPGAPKTGIFSIDAPLKNEKIGVGLSMEYDKIGISNYTGITGIYSYKINIEQNTLSFGLQVGMGFSNTNFSSVKYSEGAQDDEAFQSDFHDVLPNFGFGLFYNTEKFYAGFSIPQIAGHALQSLFYSSSESAHLDLTNHYMLTAGYVYDLLPEVRIKPSVLMKYVTGAPLEIDLNGVVWFYDMVSLGISYRSLASFDFLAEIRINNQFNIGYAYEYATSEIKSFSSGSHEIMLQYLFDFSHAKVITPRFF